MKFCLGGHYNHEFKDENWKYNMGGRSGWRFIYSLDGVMDPRTYGTLLFAMTDQSFRNGLQNKRVLFVKNVMLPTAGMFLFFIIINGMCRKMNRRRAAYISGLLLAVSVLGACGILDAGMYLKREYR